MKYSKSTLTVIIILINSILSAQNLVQKINRENFIGQKIKFLKENDDISYRYDFCYRYFGKTEKCFPYLSYSQFNGRSAIFISKNQNIYTLKLDDNNEIIYFELNDYSEIPYNIGFISILDSAKIQYIDKIFVNADLEECKITDIKYAEDSGEFSKQDGPYNVYYITSRDTLMKNVNITETYGPKEGYTHDHQRDKVFENIFSLKRPYIPVTISNIEDKFHVDIDKIDNFKTYIHKYISNNELASNLIFTLDFDRSSLLTKIVSTKGVPHILFISNFYSNNWIFHSYIKVKIGNITKQTSPVKSRTKVLNSGLIRETNYYDFPSDITILKWIAENYTNEINVRFYGKDEFEDVVLSKKEKLAIKETVDLYKILNQKNGDKSKTK